MRFSIKLTLPKPEIPIYYRTAFVSYIKKLLEGTPYFDLYYNRKFPKPFTFAVYLPIKTIERDKIFLKTDQSGETFITWNISFADPKLAVTFAGEILKKQTHKWRNEIELQLKEIKPVKDKISEDATKVVVKTLSPILIRDKNKKVVEPIEQRFEKEFNKVQERIFKTLGYSYSWVKIRPKKCEKKSNFYCIKKLVVKLKLAKYEKETQKELLKLPAYEGIFELEGQPEVLKKLYQKGLGQRTAEGFGMVEVKPL